MKKNKDHIEDIERNVSFLAPKFLTGFLYFTKFRHSKCQSNENADKHPITFFNRGKKKIFKNNI